MNSSRKWTLYNGLRAVAETFKQKVTKPQSETLYYGLVNQGATCYLNSVLQVLFMTTEIHDRLVPGSEITDQELRSLFKNLKGKTCGTENITKTLEINNVNQQRDAAECLELILQKVSPQASEVFQGQLTYTIKCSKGHIINEETNPFWTLPLPLKDTHDSAFSVEDSFKRIFQTKTYTGDNMVYCNECNNKTEATSGCEMVDSPQILILLLKRFDFDYNTMSHFKSDCCVEVPCELQLKNKTYTLYGMVDHMGSLRGGHYTATVLSDEDRSWYEFDNTRVNKVKEQPFAKTGPYNSRTVYLLTYRAAESQMSPETRKLDDLRQDNVEPKRSLERDADDEDKGQIRQNDTDEVQKTSDEALSSQTGGEKGTAETQKIVLDDEVRSETEPESELLNREKPREEEEIAGESECERFGSHDKDDQSDGEISHIRDVKTDENCGTASEVENSVDVEAQDNLNVNVGEQSKDSCEQHPDEETKTEKEEQRAAECQKPVETISEDLTEVEEEQGEDTGPEELKEDEEPKRNSERNTDDEEPTQMGHSAEDEGQMTTDRKEERLQARGEEGDAENVETETSINDQSTVSEVKSSAGEETQENEDSNTQENNKSEELNETRVEDASVNVGEQSKDSCEQHLDEETKTEEEQRAAECQKPVETTSEDPTEVEEEQGEDTGSKELKEDEEPKRNSERNTDDEETTQMGHSAEDEGQMRKDGKEEGLQARGEEGDAENVETDTSINNQTVSEVKSSEDEETQENEDSNTPESSKSEDLNETRVEDASVNVGEQLKDSCEHLDEETKTEEEQRVAECQKPVETTSEDPTEVEEEQGEDTGPEEQKEDEEPKRNTDDEETTQMGHSAEDEGQMRKDGKEEGLQARGEEGDAENVETDTSINNQTVSEVKSSEDEETQENEDSNTPENSKSEDLNETRVEDASVNVGEQLKDSCEHLDEETKTEEEQGAAECQKPVETTSEDPTEVEEEQGEDTGPEELKEDEEPKRNTDDEEPTQMGQSAEDEGQMRKDGKEERLQARGEEGGAENVETDTSINNQTVSEVKSSGSEETQENEDSNTRENSKSEEVNETRVEDASVNVGEQLKDSCEHLDEETKTEEEQRAAECQKPVETTSEDPTEVEEEQGEDTGPEELKEDEEPKRNSERNTDDEETTQMGHSAEDEGQMTTDGKEEGLQARGEEGDAENVETDTSIINQTVSEVKSSAGEETQENEDSNTQENNKSEDLNESRVEDASVYVGEQSKDSCEPHLDEETKTEKEEQRATDCQKPVETISQDVTDE